jgi:hypothetical protein
MQNHVKVYLKHFGYSAGEYIPCENCGGTGAIYTTSNSGRKAAEIT